uniref:HDC19077 n=1 Tax=Drosophila melanogaster TaxID=7227 RepID=Q6IIB6_DROME|nr:TPA_inf: HDC19077 [Drosophila melanogaster]
MFYGIFMDVWHLFFPPLPAIFPQQQKKQQVPIEIFPPPMMTFTYCYPVRGSTFPTPLPIPICSRSSHDNAKWRSSSSISFAFASSISSSSSSSSCRRRPSSK